jgi:hypothetical protein
MLDLRLPINSAQGLFKVYGHICTHNNNQRYKSGVNVYRSMGVPVTTMATTLTVTQTDGSSAF